MQTVTIEVKPIFRFPGQTAFEASVKDGPEWMRHQTETASTENAAFERFSTRLTELYAHRAAFRVERATQ